MAKGWIKLYRQLQESKVWSGESFSRGQAWVDLLLSANHKPGVMFVRGVPVPVDRGEVGQSTRTLAKRWRWSRGKTIRFLVYLESVQQIVQQKSNVSTVIRIVNYDTYQADDTTDDTTDGPQTGHRRATDGPQTGRNKKEENEENEKKGRIKGAAPQVASPSFPGSLSSEAFRSAWSTWVKHRSEIRKPLKPTQMAAQLKKLAQMGEARAIAAIEHTVEKGWQGLREPEAGAHPRGLTDREARNVQATQSWLEDTDGEA